jgi:hypothetical protein
MPCERAIRRHRPGGVRPPELELVRVSAVTFDPAVLVCQDGAVAQVALVDVDGDHGRDGRAHGRGDRQAAGPGAPVDPDAVEQVEVGGDGRGWPPRSPR